MTKGNVRRVHFSLHSQTVMNVEGERAWQQGQEAERLNFNHPQEAKKDWKWGEAINP